MLIKNARHAAAVLALVIFAIPAAQAQSDGQTVEYSVASIQQIALSGAPHLDIITATAGTPAASIDDATATYAIWTNTSGCTITASATAMPSGLTLSANLTAPTGGGASSAGKVSLTTTAQTMVSGI